MAEEKKSGGAAGAGEEPSKVELQRQMEETREDISETVAEIRDVVTTQYEEVVDKYESVRESVTEVLDWREHFTENPIVWGAGAVSIGILIGLGLANVMDGDEPRKRRRKSDSEGLVTHLLGEASGLADAVLPTLTGKVKEMFGLDLMAYLPSASEHRPARKTSAKKRSATAKKSASKKSGAKRSAAKKVATKKRASG
jgi:hypothetical protein